MQQAEHTMFDVCHDCGWGPPSVGTKLSLMGVARCDLLLTTLRHANGHMCLRSTSRRPVGEGTLAKLSTGSRTTSLPLQWLLSSMRARSSTLW